MIERRESHFMRVTTLVVVMCGALIASSAVAQVEVTIPEAACVKTTAKVENGILGVANSFTRFRGTARECVGACFDANTTKTRVWTSRNSDCNLDCSGSDPVGGC